MHTSLAAQVAHLARKSVAIGLNQGSSGNVSARSADGFVITPSGREMAELAGEEMVAMDMAGQVLGTGQPSSEWRFHRDIYAAFPEANAVVHAHSPFAVALSCLRRPIPPFHYMVAMAGGTDIRCAGYATFGTQALSDQVIEALQGRRACLMANHGLVAWGRGLEGALALALEAEALCGQYLRACQVGEPVLLGESRDGRGAGKVQGLRGARLMRWLSGLVLVSVLALAGLFFALTDPSPGQSRPASISVQDLARGKIIVDSLGLRRLRDGETRQWLIAESDLDRGLNYLAARFARGSAGARIDLDRLVLRAALPLPIPRLRRYLNLEVTLAPDGEMLVPVQARVGKIRLPSFVVGRLAPWALYHSPYGVEFAAALEMLDSARLKGQALDLRFTWHSEAMERVVMGQSATSPDRALLEIYRGRLAQVRGREFAPLLGEAFALAQARSQGRDPVTENRAALTVLAERVLGGRLISGQGTTGLGRPTGIRLEGRDDFAQHFALSAFLAATGGGGFSDTVGLYKELRDARGGSGFSFTDLAADRAGSRLGEESTASPEAARRIQARLAGSRDWKAYFPPARDLPEYMHQAEFQRRFGGVGQPAYQAMAGEIERRVAALELYK